MSLQFLQTYSSKSTVKVYKWALKGFFSVLGFKGDLRESARIYLSQERNYEEDVAKYFMSLKGKPPKTVDISLSAVKMFLMENGVELPALFWRRLKGRRRGSRALMMDKVPSNMELRRILSHMDAKGRSLFLTLASSGMRIGESLRLRLGDMELDRDPPKINIRGEYTKTGNPRIAFISREAKEALEEWLKIRDKYLEQAAGRSTRYKKRTQDDRIWPFRDNTAYLVWRNAVEKAGFNQRQAYNGTIERYTVHPHVLRKFFRTRMGSVIPVDIVEALMGHESYLTEVYRKYSEEDLAKFYLQGEPALLTSPGAAEMGRLKKDLEERDRQLQRVISGLAAENVELRERLRDLEVALEKFAKEIGDLRRQLEDLARGTAKVNG